MIILAFLVIGVIFAIVGHKWFYSADCDSVWEGLSLTMTIIGFGLSITAIVIGIIAGAENVHGPVELVEKQITYESLMHQAEVVRYDNDNDLGKKELANQIEEYNKEVAVGKLRQHDFWIGCFYANIYDQLELIPVSVLE